MSDKPARPAEPSDASLDTPAFAERAEQRAVAGAGRDVGEKFAHYQIETLLGQGGMGQVYRAFDTKLHRRVALKLLLAPAIASPEAKLDAVARIIREARAAAAVEHPNKVSIFELGEVDGTPYLAMEYIAGSTLRPFVGDAAVDWQRKLGWLLDVARALDAAHGAGLVHRDIKPENVMLREDGIVKVLDFGIARRASTPTDPSAPTAAPSIEALTASGVVIGTAAYMPPEQMHGDELDGRADQFAWGVMAFELLSGKHPWASNAGGLALIGAMLSKPAAPLEGVPSAVADTIRRTLRAERGDRFARMSEIVSLLAPLVAPSGPAPVVSTDREALASGATDVAMARTDLAEKQPVARPLVHSRRRALRIAAAGVAALAVALLGVIGARRWFAAPAPETMVVHCVDHTMTRTGPRCLGELPADAVSRRRATYRLTSSRHGVDTIERLNSAGIVIDRGDPARTEIRRAQDGAVQEVVARDRNGEEMRHEVWSESGARVDLVEADGKTPSHIEGTRATTLRREFDERGFVRRELYFGPAGKPRASERGVFGRELQHAADGFVERETYLGWDGQPMANHHGVATVARAHDGRGVVLEETTLDLDGHPRAVDDVVTLRVEYTKDLSVVGVAFFDAAGGKVSNLTYGTHAIRWDFEPGARRLRITYLDDSGRPRQLKGDTYTSIEYLFDERGRELEETYLDASGNPVVEVQDGGAIWRYAWDEGDRRIAQQIFDSAKRPMPCRWGFASRKEIRDALGRVVELRHFDIDGKPTPWVDGPATAKYTRDERGLRTAETLLDADDRPAVVANGYAASRTKYDRLRNQIEYAVFGLDGKPFWSREGFSMQRDRYDEDDNLVEVSTFDTSGALAFGGESGGSFARKRMKHDDRGLVIEESYFDTNDNPVLTKEGFAIVRRVRDRSGDITEETYFGKSGEPIARTGGYAKKKHAYEIHRRRIETALFDAAGAPVVGSDGWSVERISYDHRGMVARESHFDTAGKAVISKAGSASVSKKYDARGNLIEVATLGADDAPIVTTDGHALKKNGYDERDQLIEESLFGANGAPILGIKGWSVRKLRYDDLGNLVDESFFDAERKPVVAKDPAYARKRDKYDARRRLIETSYFDVDGAPAKGPDEVETIRYVRDAYGRAVETAYFSATQASTSSKDGKQVVRSTYDDAGRLLEESFLDASGNPRPAKDGCAGHRTKYDERGHAVQQKCLDGKDGLSMSTDGWAVKIMLRDVRGLVIDESTAGADGTSLKEVWLRADASGVARRKNRYDERGLLLETTFWTAEDKPARDPRGAVAIRYRYDDAGKEIAKTLIDDKGREVPGDASTARAPAP